jgi:hypothetical protein
VFEDLLDHVPLRRLDERDHLQLTWHNGGRKPPKDVMLGYTLTEWGCLVSGSKGAIFSSCPWNTRFLLLPEAQFAGHQGPAPSLPRSRGHHVEWIQACKGGPPPFSPFAIGGPLTELILLAHVAALAGRSIDYDPLGRQDRQLPRGEPVAAPRIPDRLDPVVRPGRSDRCPRPVDGAEHKAKRPARGARAV